MKIEQEPFCRDFSSLAVWEVWMGQQGHTGPQGQPGQVGYCCKKPEKHRLYHVMGVDCPCLPKYVQDVGNRKHIGTFLPL